MSEHDPCPGCDGDCDVCVCDGIGYGRGGALEPGLTYRLNDTQAERILTRVQLNDALTRKAD